MDALEQALRGWERPIIGRISRGRYLLDVRTLTGGDMEEILRALSHILSDKG